MSFPSDDESSDPIVPAGAHLAPFGRRIGGLAIDLVVINVPVLVAFFSAGYDPAEALSDGRVVWVSVAVTLVGLAYETVGVWRWGRTLGKLATGTRVVGLSDGGPVGLARAFQRSLVPATVSAIPQIGILFGIGVYTWAFVDPLRQGIHDKAAGSIVVMARPAAVHT